MTSIRSENGAFYDGTAALNNYTWQGTGFLLNTLGERASTRACERKEQKTAREDARPRSPSRGTTIIEYL